MKVVCVIPARYASTRMPGKPLLDICGHPMLWWVYQNAMKVREFDRVYIATDDVRIKDACEAFGADVIMTSDNLTCLIERVYEVSNVVEADYYVSVNGDEPILEPEVMPRIIPDFVEKDKPIARGLVREFSDPAEVVDPGNLKLVIGEDGYALYASRTPIPYPQKSTDFKYKKYVGVELWNRKALEFYVSHGQTKLEKIEDIGLLRFLEHGLRVHYTVVESNSLSVDTPHDLEEIRGIIAGRMEGQG